MKTYRVRDWEKYYETAETRKLVNLRWLPVPNKHDGLDYRRITAQPDATDLFAAWILILQVASKGRGPDERGNLLRGQEALGAEDLAMMTGFPVKIFTRALEFFSSPKQGWLLVHEDELALSPARPADSPVTPASSPAVWNGMEGKEGNGISSPAGEVADQKPRARNLLMDELATIAGIPLTEIGQAVAKRLNAVITTIKQSTPDVTPDEIRRRAENYRTHMRDAALTPEALAKHWGTCHEAGKSVSTGRKMSWA